MRDVPRIVPAPRQDPARRLDRQLVVLVLEHAAPAVAKADEGVAVDVDALADDRADDGIQPGAVAPSGEDSEAHRQRCRMLFVATFPSIPAGRAL